MLLSPSNILVLKVKQKDLKRLEMWSALKAILSVIWVAILDFMQIYILRYQFDRTNRFLHPENICLDTKIISLSDLPGSYIISLNLAAILSAILN